MKKYRISFKYNNKRATAVRVVEADDMLQAFDKLCKEFNEIWVTSCEEL
jgi:hypothetical protein